MANVVNTYGTAEQFVKSALMGLGATQQDPNGRFYLDGNLVNVELSRVLAETIYIGEIFRDGQSVTGKYTTDVAAGSVRVALDTPYGFTSRTTAYGGRKGTPGNHGTINVNPALLPTNDEFLVYLNQINDQPLLFPQISMEYMPLDLVAKKIATYARSVVQDRSAQILAEILAYNFMRALGGGDNIVNVADLSAKDAYGDLTTDLNTKLDNGDIQGSAYTFANEGRTIIGRPKFINKAFTRNSGLILLGGDIAQNMLREYNLDADMSSRDFVGSNYKGHAAQFHWQSAPDYIWYLAELYLGLPKGALDNVDAVACSYEATAVGRVNDLGVKIIDANEVRGSKAQPLNIWGSEAFRKSQIIGDESLTTDYLKGLGFTEDERVWPIAPATTGVNDARDQVQAPIYGPDGAIIGYRVVAEGATPNGGNFNDKVDIPEVPEA